MFVENLLEAASCYVWEIEENGNIRAEASNGQRFCPITAAAFEITGRFYKETEVAEAARVLDVSERISFALVRAADGCFLREPLYPYAWRCFLLTKLDLL